MMKENKVTINEKNNKQKMRTQILVLDSPASSDDEREGEVNQSAQGQVRNSSMLSDDDRSEVVQRKKNILKKTVKPRDDNLFSNSDEELPLCILEMQTSHTQ